MQELLKVQEHLRVQEMLEESIEMEDELPYAFRQKLHRINPGVK